MNRAALYGLSLVGAVAIIVAATSRVQADETITINTVSSVDSTTTSSSSTSTSSTTSSSTSSTTTTSVFVIPIDRCAQPIDYPDMIGLTIAQVQTANIEQFPECGTVSLQFWGYTPDGVRVVGGYPCVDGHEPVVESQIPIPHTATTLNELVASGTQITWTCG